MEIVFQIPNPPRGFEPYQFPKTRVLIEAPDDAETSILFPRLVITPAASGTYVPFGTWSVVFEETRDRFGKGTVVVCSNSYEERIVLEVWATTRAQRRSLMSGLEQMLSNVVEEMPGVRFFLPDYYGETASFQLAERQNIDDEDAGRRRRRAHLTLVMSHNIVRLVNVQELRPTVVVGVSD